MHMEKGRPNPYLTTRANATPTTPATRRARSKPNPYQRVSYLCPNPDCKGRNVWTSTVNVAVYRAQLLTWRWLFSDSCWKAFFIYGGLAAALLIPFLFSPVLALESRIPILLSLLALLLSIGGVCLLFVLVWYYVLPPKIKVEVHRCFGCHYMWQQFRSPAEAISQWAEGEKRRATKRGKKEEMAQTLITFSYLAICKKDWQQAESYASECLKLSVEAKSDRMSAHAREHLGQIALLRGQYGEAITQYESCLPQFRKLREWGCLAHSLGNLGLARLYQGITAGVAALFAEDLSFVLKMHDTVDMSWTCAGMAGLAALQDQPERAARLYGASRAVCEGIGAQSLALDDCPGFNQSVEATRERLGGEEYEKAWQAGHVMRLDEAMTYCVRCFRPSPVPPSGDAPSQPNRPDGQVTSETKSLEELITDLGRDDAMARDAALALARTRDSNAVDPLIQALRHGNPAVREGAAVALGQIRDPRAIQPLIAALADPGDPSQEHKWNPADLAADALISFGERAVEPLVDALLHPDPAVRYQAVSVLMELPAVPPIDLFIAMLRDSDPGVRWMAAHALGQLGDVRGVPELERVGYEERQAAAVEEAHAALSQIRSRRHSAFWQERLIEELASLRASLV